MWRWRSKSGCRDCRERATYNIGYGRKQKTCRRFGECSKLTLRNTAATGKLEESALDQMISYSSQNGRSFQTSIRDILLQVLLHGQYHRGQINRALRMESAEPAPVDYIAFSRL
ncbi:MULTISPECIES: DinB family protein [unclassified Paenibacillus]|uniref:DinB family protein n=1 Tax=unclassified Paenibacillus TaxID=185978 RepID=UPI0030F5BE7A